VSTATDVAVVGGGIAGLAAAWELATGTPPCRVTLLEGSDRLGGKIETSMFAGVPLDAGPDAFLARVPAAAQLAREAGLEHELVAPGTGHAWMWARGRLRRLPTGLVLGVPLDFGALARSRVLPARDAARAALDLVLPGAPVGPEEDVSVGWLVRRRMGRAVQLGLVDPLLGGINAGHTDHLSAAVAAPQLLAAARRGASLARGLRASGTGGTATGAVTENENSLAPNRHRIGANARGGAVFLTVRGGLGRLVDAVAGGLSARGGTVRCGDPVIGLSAGGAGWELRTAAGQSFTAGAVVVACPAAGLLRQVSPGAANELAAIGWSSVALVSLAYRERDAPGWEGSGFLVPRGEGRLVTAGSWVGQKWPHLAVPGLLVVRASAGRVDDRRADDLDDDELVAAAHADLAAAMGLRGPPVERRVSRWPRAFA